MKVIATVTAGGKTTIVNEIKKQLPEVKNFILMIIPLIKNIREIRDSRSDNSTINVTWEQAWKVAGIVTIIQLLSPMVITGSLRYVLKGVVSEQFVVQLSHLRMA